MIKLLWHKNGEFSKTALLLVFSFILVSIKYITGGLVIGKLVIPEFNPASAFAFLGVTATLYFSTHNIQIRLDKPSSKPKPEPEKPYYIPPESEKEYKFSTNPSSKE